MSESLIERLRRFTPEGTGLNRDGLLFAAGRASARPNRGWMALAGLLVAAQVVTLALLWPRSAPRVESPSPAPPPPLVIEQAPSASERPPLLVLRQQVLEADGNLPAPAPVEPAGPSEPPLRAMGPLPGALLD